MKALEKVERLKAELDSLRPLNAEAEARIMQKFRLDWNYHSNNIEGNSLTYGETKALILFGITAQGKPLKDHFEITGHNEAINWILEIVKDKSTLTETFIRELHTLLLKESSYKEALTPEGKPTRRKIEVGKYKTQPNHVITVTGETFYFATPEETPAKMQELVKWFRNEKEKPDVNSIILAALFHYRFIRIHPFDDGNGRVARILMNFILMQFGYPPVIIKTEDKENYFAVLRLADADELEPFIEYIAQNLIHSLEVMIKGAKGEDIEEPDDLDKELALLDKKLEKAGRKIKAVKSFQTINELFDESLIPLAKYLENQCSKFKRFYIDTLYIIQVNQFKSNRNISEAKTLFEYLDTIQNTSEKMFGKLQEVDSQTEAYVEKDIETAKKRIKSLTNGFIFQFRFTSFNREYIEAFNHNSTVYVLLNKKNYVVSNSTQTIQFKKLYSEALGQDEIKLLVKTEIEKHKAYIEENLKKLQLKN
ncbi:MAG TPA: Fic family protein [Pyrinomonadaceae bacterium]|jgi:Fic family protein